MRSFATYNAGTAPGFSFNCINKEEATSHLRLSTDSSKRIQQRVACLELGDQLGRCRRTKRTNVSNQSCTTKNFRVNKNQPSLRFSTDFERLENRPLGKLGWTCPDLTHRSALSAVPAPAASWSFRRLLLYALKMGENVCLGFLFYQKNFVRVKHWDCAGYFHNLPIRTSSCTLFSVDYLAWRGRDSILN